MQKWKCVLHEVPLLTQFISHPGVFDKAFIRHSKIKSDTPLIVLFIRSG
jgi:hypothetical protein